MTDIETVIMIKNMAREIVQRMSVKNAMRGAEVTAKTDDGQTVTWRTSINGTDEAIKEYFRPGKRINIGDGPRDRMTTIKSVKVLNAAAKNAALTVKRDFTWGRSFASGPASMREVKIKAGAPVEKKGQRLFCRTVLF